ncbi:MAG: hypothetical protein LUQ01_06275 [Methanolinea sp.]|nr:hypothetical protein [Methanolinea sp.]
MIIPETPTRRHIFGLILFPATFFLVLPLTLSFLLRIPAPSALALVAAVLVIEYGAIAPAVVLGLDLPFSMAVSSLVCLGVLFTSFEIFDLLSLRSGKIRAFLARVEGIRITCGLRRYGILALVPGMIVVGFYVCPAAAWIIGWRKGEAIAVMYAGFLASSMAVALLTAGLLPVVFGPG